MRSRGAKGRVGPKPVLLLDECICSKTVIDALGHAGEEVRTVIGEYGRGRRDLDWLADAGQKRYVGLTYYPAPRRCSRRTPAMSSNPFDYAIAIGGAAGQGIATPGNLLSRIFIRRGLHMNAYNAYQSIIRGGHIFLTVRVSGAPVHSHGD